MMMVDFVVVHYMVISMGRVVGVVAVVSTNWSQVVDNEINMSFMAVAEVMKTLIDFMSSTWGEEASSLAVVVAGVGIHL